jgi:hypothetical protein
MSYPMPHGGCTCTTNSLPPGSSSVQGKGLVHQFPAAPDTSTPGAAIAAGAITAVVAETKANNTSILRTASPINLPWTIDRERSTRGNSRAARGRPSALQSRIPGPLGTPTRPEDASDGSRVTQGPFGSIPEACGRTPGAAGWRARTSGNRPDTAHLDRPSMPALPLRSRTPDR